MILKGVNNQTVELKIAKNKLTENVVSNLSDTDWLRVYLNIYSNLGNWQTVDESLMVYEFKELIKWFRDLSLNKKVTYPELYFTEPNLEFDIIEGVSELKNIKMVFWAESRPKFAKKDQEYFVEFKFSNAELSKIIEELEKELKQLFQD